VLLPFCHNLKRAIQLMLRKPVVVWKASGIEFPYKPIRGQQDSKRTSTILRGVVARADSLHVCPNFYLDGSQAAKFVDQLVTFILDPVQDFHIIFIADSKHIRGSLRQRPAKSRFVRYDAVREVAMAETTILMREPRMTEAIAMSETGGR
jgi:hypothetical protein